MRLLRTISATLVLALALPVFPAAADDAAAAEALFNDGKALMEQGKFAEACPKLEASLAYDKNAGGTILRLGACYQGLKRWGSAWGKFHEALTRAKQAGRADRVDAATKGIAEVEKYMSRLTVRVDAKARVSGLELKLDGAVVPEGAWATATPIDPGSHTLVASAPGYKTWQTTITVAETIDNKAIDVPKLDAAAAPGTTSTTDTEPTKWHVTTTEKFVAVGVGAVLVGAGVGMYMKARSERDQYFDDCKLQQVINCDDPAGRTRVRTWETLAYVAGGVGLAAIGVGVTLLVTGKPSEGKPAARVVAAPTVASTGGGLSVVGEF